jgi:uncharacterized ion transporter superfamily protein YfcC
VSVAFFGLMYDASTVSHSQRVSTCVCVCICVSVYIYMYVYVYIYIQNPDLYAQAQADFRRQTHFSPQKKREKKNKKPRGGAQVL